MLQSSKKRDSNLEILRILGMFLIILYHSVRHADYGKMLAEPFGLNSLINVILTSWGQVGNILFVFISSWFLIEQEGICFKKVMSIFLQAWSYSVLILVFVTLGRLRPVGLKEMVKALITPFYGGYWFITTYLVFYMLVPVLRYLTQKVTVDTLKRICLLLTILIPIYNVFFENPGAALADFCYTFFLAAYLKKEENNWFEQHSCGGGIAGILLVVACIIFGQRLNPGNLGLSITKHLVDYRGPAIYFISICLFYCFNKIKIGFHSVINKIAKTTLGVYLIHDNELLREILWNQLFDIITWFEKSNWYAFYLLCIASMIFLICMIIELIRSFIISRCLIIENNKVQKICQKVDQWYMVK